MSLQTVPIRKTGNRDNLFLGGDRELVLFTALICATLILASQSLYAAITGIFLWFSCIYFLRKMAKADPKLRFVYLRQLKYKPYYPAHPTVFRKNKRTYR